MTFIRTDAPADSARKIGFDHLEVMTPDARLHIAMPGHVADAVALTFARAMNVVEDKRTGKLWYGCWEMTPPETLADPWRCEYADEGLSGEAETLLGCMSFADWLEAECNALAGHMRRTAAE